MKFLKLLRSKAFIVNLFIFAFISVSVSFICAKMPRTKFAYKKWLFRARKWEKNGTIYQNIFKVKAWKKFLPELSDFIKSVVPKKHIKEYNSSYLTMYLYESCRAEFTHWNIILVTYLYRLWNDSFSAIIMVIFSIIFNLPYIIIQRYNRPRVIRMMEKIELQATA